MSSPTTITVYTSAATAVRKACAAGWHTLTLDLNDWSPEERAVLATFVVDTDRGPRIPVDRLDIAPATADHLRAMIANRIAAAQADDAEEAAAEAAAIEAAKQLPITDLLRAPRIGDRSAIEATGRQAEAEAYHAMRRAKDAAQQQQRQAETEKAAAALVELVCSLAPALAHRARAGVIPKAERDAVLRALLLPVLDATGPSVEESLPPRIATPSSPLDGLTENEFLALLRAEKAAQALRLPGGGAPEVEIRISSDRWSYNPDSDNADRDGDVQINDFRAARIEVKATIYGIDIRLTRWVTCESTSCGTTDDD